MLSFRGGPFFRRMRTPAAVPAVSLIVPFHNPSRRFFSALLDSIAVQATTDPFDVVLVDNRSDDGTPELAHAWCRGRDARVVTARGRANASYARNVGARHARGRAFLFVDADDEIGPGYVDAMARALETHPFVTSRVDSATLNSPWTCDAQGDWQQSGIPVAFDFLPTCGSNIGIRRDWFLRVGGFPESFARGEDAAFCWNLQLAGAPVHFVADAIYRYRHRASAQAAFRQAFAWGASDAHLYRHYQRHGMPARPWRKITAEWRDAVVGLIAGPEPGARAASLTRLGHCLGRAAGSVTFQVRYF